MHEILSILSPKDRVLDLGSRFGSFPSTDTRAQVFRLDLEPAHQPNSIAANACQLPFRDGSFRAVIANHSLEHIAPLSLALAEIARVLAPDGYLYVAIPDADTMCDRVYRWLASGGGHVNAITNADDFSRELSAATQLPRAGIRTLHTGFSYLNRRSAGPFPRRIWLVGGGLEWTLQIATLIFRLADRAFGTRLSVYGWSFYFGKLPPVSQQPWTNVCVRCGSGHPSSRLSRPIWRCANCQAANFFTRDS